MSVETLTLTRFLHGGSLHGSEWFTSLSMLLIQLFIIDPKDVEYLKRESTRAKSHSIKRYS